MFPDTMGYDNNEVYISASQVVRVCMADYPQRYDLNDIQNGRVAHERVETGLLRTIGSFPGWDRAESRPKLTSYQSTRSEVYHHSYFAVNGVRIGARLDAVLMGERSIAAVEIKRRKRTISPYIVLQLMLECMALKDQSENAEMIGLLYLYGDCERQDEVHGLQGGARDWWEWGAYVAKLAGLISQLQSSLDKERMSRKAAKGPTKAMPFHDDMKMTKPEWKRIADEEISIRHELDEAFAVLIPGIAQLVTEPIEVYPLSYG